MDRNRCRCLRTAPPACVASSTHVPELAAQGLAVVLADPVLMVEVEDFR
jgi:hypothetical protein